jgi:ABC-type dipeptide/oligopeptide/nickel transport system, ATPase component
MKYKDLYALDHINATFKDNIISGITGSSGAGKTTLANIISGYDKDYSGEILYNGSKEKSPQYIRYVFQDPYVSMNQVKTVEWHIATAANINNVKIEDAIKKLEMAGMSYEAYSARYGIPYPAGNCRNLH